MSVYAANQGFLCWLI